MSVPFDRTEKGPFDPARLSNDDLNCGVENLPSFTTHPV